MNSYKTSLLSFLGVIPDNTKAEFKATLKAITNDLGLEIISIHRVQKQSSLMSHESSSLLANNRRIAS